jgi:UDPglucose 6-dehydrogenase
MKIGVVGLGVVGGAVYHGLNNVGHDVYFHDLKHKTSIEDVIDTEICFVCVPTPSKSSGECDTSIVEDVVAMLNKKNYKGIVAIKSTVEPGTTDRLSEQFKNLDICFVPEFLRERCALEDFLENHDLCVIGTENDYTYEKLKICHGNLPEQFVRLTKLEAELVKYFNNIYNATLVTFANSFYEVCDSLNANYSKVKDTVVKREHINDTYLNCGVNLRGFGGPCLPKDTRTIAALARKNNTNVEFFDMLLKENSKYKVTVFEGMREE